MSLGGLEVNTPRPALHPERGVEFFLIDEFLNSKVKLILTISRFSSIEFGEHKNIVQV